MPNYRYWIEKQNNGRWRLMLGEKGQEMQRTGGLTQQQAEEIILLLGFVFDSTRKVSADTVAALCSVRE